jgi:hypothetical protein
MMRRGMRRGPGLVGTVARTAVIAGTATAVSGAVIGHQQKKAAGQAAEQAEADQVQQMQAELDAMQAQQAQATMAPAAAPAPAAGGTDIAAQLQQLAQLQAAGVLSQAEFDAAKAKLLGI